MKKIFSFVVVMAAVAMVSCCGNSNKKAAEGEAAAAAATTEAAACTECTEKCDSTEACCAEKCDSTKDCAEKAEGECCNKSFLSGMRVKEIRKNPLFLCPYFRSRGRCGASVRALLFSESHGPRAESHGHELSVVSREP